MLVLTRKIEEAIVIGNNITVTVLSISNGKVKLGIEAPPEVSVHRQEIQQRIDQENTITDEPVCPQSSSA